MKLVNLTSRLHSQENFLDAAALFDVLLIALMFVLLSSRFVLAPGTNIELAELGAPADSRYLSAIDADLTVLNAKSDSMLIFNGAVYTPETFAKQMQFDGLKKTYKGGVLLVKADKTVSSQRLMNICSLAKIGGFSRVQIAAKESKKNEANN